MPRQQNRQKDPNVKKVTPSRANLNARGTSKTNLRVDNKNNTATQNEIARLVRRSGNTAGFSGRGINQTVRPITVYNLEKGLSKAALRKRVETMMGRKLTSSEARHLKSTRVKSLDQKVKQSSTDRFGREIRSFRTLEAYKITYS